MAATAQSELYDGLIRRIGYSVGLEYLLERVGDLTEVYLSRGTVDGADWRDLVHARWGRRAPADQHIADVYAQLELIRRHNNTIQVLPALDVIAILLRGSNPLLPSRSGPAPSRDVLRFVLTTKILEADGDIFLNALASGFRPIELRRRLQQLVQYKRSRISPFFKQAANIRRVMDAVSIRNQSEGTDRGKKLTYAQKSRLLMTGITPHPTTAWYEQEVTISDDYLDKACVTRSGWAEELGFFRRREGLLTAEGEQLLEQARAIGLTTPGPSAGNTYAFWPYGFQLRRMSLPPEDLGFANLTPWDLLGAISRTYRRPDRKAPQALESPEPDRAEWIALLDHALKLYRDASRRGMIRHELPLFIAETVLAFWLAEARASWPDFRGFLRSEIQRRDRLIDLIMIHGTEGGLRMMSEGEAGRGFGR